MGANVKKKGDIDRTNAVSVFFLVVAETVRVICMEAQSFSPACFCFPLQLPKHPLGAAGSSVVSLFFFVQTKRAYRTDENEVRLAAQEGILDENRESGTNEAG